MDELGGKMKYIIVVIAILVLIAGAILYLAQRNQSQTNAKPYATFMADLKAGNLQSVRLVPSKKQVQVTMKTVRQGEAKTYFSSYKNEDANALMQALENSELPGGYSFSESFKVPGL
jgi:ATP-dependent Zn protease